MRENTGRIRRNIGKRKKSSRTHPRLKERDLDGIQRTSVREDTEDQLPNTEELSDYG